MNFNNFPRKKTLPTIKQRTILVPKRAPGVNIPHSGGIAKPVRPQTLSVSHTLHKIAKDLYPEDPSALHSLAVHAQSHGVSLKNIEGFDLTLLWGIREALCNARSTLLTSPPPLSSLRQAGSPSPHDSKGEDGEELLRADALALPMVSNSRPLATPPLPPAASTFAPRRKTVNRPSAPPGPPPNAVYAMGSRQIPQAVQNVVDEILAFSAQKTNKMGFPQRVNLRNMSAGIVDLDRRYGYIAAGSKLMGFYGDLRIFDERTWKYLVSAGKGEDGD